MNKRQDYVTLELSGDKLNHIVGELRDKLLNEFWQDVPESDKRRQISDRLEKNILASFDYQGEKIEAT
jgi:hypothetical protein